MLRWLAKNISTLLLAFLLALVVWVSAVVSTDPNEEAIYPRQVTLEVINQGTNLLLVSELPEQVRVTINAPRSIWERLTSNSGYVRAWVDLSGIANGEHVLPIHTQISISPARVVQIEPAEVTLILEPIVTRTERLKLNVVGEPALGYRKGTIALDPPQVTISGPESRVGRIAEARISLDISNANDTIRRSITVQVLDEKGAVVQGITVAPSAVSITQPITLQGGYRNVVVKVVTVGQVAEGYWLTNVSVSPPNVTVFSSNPSQVNELPGFVETLPLDLAGLNDDVDIRAALALPEGVTLAGEESVLVRMSIAALEGSLPISLPLEIIGLPPEYSALVEPATVDVLLTGPLPILNNLNPAGIRVSVNVTGLGKGSYQLVPVVDLLPAQVQVGSILPGEVQVTIGDALTPTPVTTVPAASIAPAATPTTTRQP